MLRFVLLFITILQSVRGGHLLEYIEKFICTPPNVSCTSNTIRNTHSAADDWKLNVLAGGLQNTLATQSCSFNSYSALGDSYSVGLGSEKRLELCPDNTTVGSTTCTTDHCWKDIGAYGYQFAKKYQIPNFQYLACSGANSTKIDKTQLESSYFYTPGSGMSPDLVSLTAGGDDFRFFADIVIACIFPVTADNIVCEATLLDAYSKLPKVQSNLRTLYSNINKQLAAKPASKTPKVVVMGVPQPFGTTNFTGPNDKGGFCPMHPVSLAERKQINGMVNRLNEITRTEATRAKFLFADSDPLWSGHRWCDTEDTWFNYNICRGECDTAGVAYNSIAYAHPFLGGQDKFMQAMEDVLGCTTAVTEDTVVPELK